MEENYKKDKENWENQNKSQTKELTILRNENTTLKEQVEKLKLLQNVENELKKEK